MEKIIRFVLHSRLLVVSLGVLVLAAGNYSYTKLPVDAFPDVSPALVQVFVETEGLAPEEVEKYVTYPIEVAMNGMPDLKEIRSVSNFGLSVVNIYFEDGTDIYFARQLVNERLQQAREQIPPGFGDPEMGPIATGMGQILFYTLEDTTGKRTPEEMREIQDWLVKFNLQTVLGVTEVLSIGGEEKQFQVRVRPDDLLRYKVTLPEIKHALEENNSNAGAQFIVKNSEQYIVRSVGLAEKIPDLERIVLKSRGRHAGLPQPGGRRGHRRRDPLRPHRHGWQGRGRGRHGPQAHRRELLRGHPGRQDPPGRDQQDPSRRGAGRPLLRPGDAGCQVRPHGD